MLGEFVSALGACSVKLLIVGLALGCMGAVAADPGLAPLPAASDLKPNPALPDPLVTLDGRRVTSRKQWERERRPELKRLFRHYMYGYTPPAPERVRATVEREDPTALGGKATLRDITLRFGPERTPPLHLLLLIPNGRRGAVPAFVGMNFAGNHTVLPDTTIRLPESWVPAKRVGVVDNRATEAGRGAQQDVWNADLIVDRGYGLATFYAGDIDPDKPDFSDGVHAAYARPDQERGPHDWGTVAAWAWGYSRVLDYLRTVEAIDRKRVAAVGHSRNGKTALLAAAMDERFAMALPLQAGCGGTAPSRGTVGESVKQINDRFPHWFNDTFKQFNERPELLPFDQHALVALVAPRPVLFANAVEDTWANPEGQFQVLQAADPVYRFLGAEGLAAREMPPVGKLVDSRLGYFIRPGKHSMNREDWAAFLDFADRHFARPGTD